MVQFVGMNLTCFGAAGEVTGSKHLLTVGKKTILLDCGMFQGHRDRGGYQNERLPFDPATIDAVILSHGHLDHCGSLPTLVKHGFRGPIYATTATRDVAELIMKDSAKIQEQDAAYHNKHRWENQPLAVPLYTDADVEAVMPHFKTLEYDQCYPIPGVGELCFYNSGHILGASIAHLTLKEGEREVRLAYTGDLGKPVMPILNGPEKLPATDVLVCESTYGNKHHEAVPESEEKLARIVRETVERRGKIFVPAFALGRMQTLIYTLHRMTDAGTIPRIPIYVDSPLAVEMTRVFEKHPECFDEETRRLFTNSGEDPFGFRNLHFVSSVEESKRLNATPGPLMILATSGMADAGRILHHFINGLSNPDNVVMVVGYMADGTLGRAILEGVKKVQIFHHDVIVRARVEKLNAYSAHADEDELVAFMAETPDLKKIFLVHGDPAARSGLEQAIEQQLPGREVILPAPGQSYPL